MTEPTPLPPPAIGPEHEQLLLDAKARFGKIRRALGIAAFNGGTLCVFGTVALLSGIFSPVAALLGAALLGAGIFEFAQRKKLRALDVSAPARLAWNQLFVSLAVAAYCIFHMTQSSGLSSAIVGELPPDLQQAMPELNGSISQMTTIVQNTVRIAYALIALLTAVSQGLLAWYYASRTKHVRAYVRETPAWVVRLQQKNAWG